MKGILLIMLIILALASCKTSGPGLFAKKSPRQAYVDNIKDAGLENTEMASKWFAAGNRALVTPISITLPYRETGYFSAGDPHAVGLRFNLKRGQMLKVSVSKKPAVGALIYIELWAAGTPLGEKPLAHSDTTNISIEYETKNDGEFILLIQPELLESIEYTVDITTGPSLAFPVKARNANIGSLWGADRDGGARRHEGIDIFAPKGTPVIASADGRVTANENELGGKVVWLRPADKEYTVYYAHLDQQLVSSGDRVKTGDTIGLVGNTGNARTTPPHLHLGIYASGGAVDPFPFVDAEIKSPPEIISKIPFPQLWQRTSVETKLFLTPDKKSQSTAVKKSSLLRVESAAGGMYRVTLPDNSIGYVDHETVVTIDKPIRELTLRNETQLLDAPAINALQKKELPAGTKLLILASFGDFNFVREGDTTGWLLAGN